MNETIRGDVLTIHEMKIRGIYIMASDRGGIELRTRDSGNTIALALIGLGFIEDFHHRDASVFMDLRRAYNASMGIKWGHLRIDLSELGLTPGKACERYDAIRHEIGIKRAAHIAKLIEIAMLEIYRKMHEAEMNIYRYAFEELSDGMMKVKQKYA